MTIVLYIVGYLACGLITGKLAANLFLNHRYRNLCKGITRLTHERYHKRMTWEQYVVMKKKEHFKEAMRASDLDRFMGMLLGTIIWPVAIVLVTIYYIWYFGNKAIQALPNGGHLGLSAAARDVYKAEKKILEVQKARELENARIDEWNTMVDLLEENNLNSMAQLKKKVKVK
jgi:hypothetical protein